MSLNNNNIIITLLLIKMDFKAQQTNINILCFKLLYFTIIQYNAILVFIHHSLIN